MKRVTRVVMLGCCAAALGACAGAEAAHPATTAPPTTTAAPTTTVPPSTTSAPTTTLSPQQRDEAEIRQIHDRFFALMASTNVQLSNPEYP